MALRMAVKCSGGGGGEVIVDHNDLQNIGKYPHSVLDEFVDEVTDARGSYSSLGSRLDDMVHRIESIENNGGGSGGNCNCTDSFMYYVYVCEEEGISTVRADEGVYVIGRNDLEVFRGGLRMMEGNDYVEVDERTIDFHQELYPNEIVVMRVRDRSNVPRGLKFHTEYIITSTDTKAIKVNHRFQTGKGVEVYVNGLLYNPAQDYVLIGQDGIRFEVPVPKGSLINVNISDKITGEEPFIIQEKFETGEMEYELTRFSYNQGMNELEVYVAGVKQTSGIDYEETSPTTFKFLKENPENLIILACKENPGAVSGHHMHNYGIIPLGDVDGSNCQYLLQHIPQQGSVLVYVGGIRQGKHTYEVKGNKVILNYPPPEGVDLFVDYIM